MQNDLSDKSEKMRSKIVGINEAATMMDIWHYMGLKVVFTNGVFDLLHLGHVDYLSRAASLGHRMVLGVNTNFAVAVNFSAGSFCNSRFGNCHKLGRCPVQYSSLTLLYQDMETASLPEG